MVWKVMRNVHFECLRGQHRIAYTLYTAYTMGKIEISRNRKKNEVTTTKTTKKEKNQQQIAYKHMHSHSHICTAMEKEEKSARKAVIEKKTNKP